LLGVFVLFGRTWQVNIEGEAKDRRDLEDIWQIHVRSKTGEMVPMRSIANIRYVVGPQVITRYNNRRSITINGSPASGASSGAALAATQGSPPIPFRRATATNGRGPPIRSTKRAARPAPSSRWR
jgi:multidrug efflux pump subunit AcrB